MTRDKQKFGLFFKNGTKKICSKNKQDGEKWPRGVKTLFL